MHIKKRKFLFEFKKESMRKSQVIFNKIRICEYKIVDWEIFISISIIVFALAIREAQILVLLVANSQISKLVDVLAPQFKAQDWAAISRISRRVIDTRFVKT